MPTYRIDSPNGSYDIEAPDEQTALRAFQQTMNAAAPGAAQPPQQPAPSAAAAPPRELSDVLNEMTQAGNPAAGLSLDEIMGTPPAPAQEDRYRRGTLLPVMTDKVTGQNTLAWPQFALDVGKAIAAPEKALSGQYGMELDPNTRRPTYMTQDMAGDAMGMAGLIGGGGWAPRGLSTTSKAALSADEFGIPLTKGQASGSLQQLAREEALRQANGGMGSGMMRSFDARQAESIRNAANRVGAELGGPSPDMGDVVQNGLRARAFAFENAANAGYAKARAGGASVKTEALDVLPASVQQSLAQASVIVDDMLTPAASVALREIEKASKRGGGLNPAAPKTGPVPTDTLAVSIDGLEQVRKRIVGLKPDTNKPADAAALKAVKDAFDKWYDDSIDNMLFSGDPKALEELKAARKNWAFYKAMTVGKEGNPASQAIAKMQREDATAEEVGNWLYGADVAHPSLNAPKVASLLKQMMGPDSKEWAAVRGAAWERLIRDFRSTENDPRSASMMANRIMDFLNSGSTLSKVLYTEQERAQMRRFATVLRKTIPPKDATNPSRSGWLIKGSLDGISRMLMTGAGAAADFALAGGGLGGGAVSFLAYPVMRGAVRGVQAARWTAPQLPAPYPKFSVSPVAAPAILGAAKAGMIESGQTYRTGGGF